MVSVWIRSGKNTVTYTAISRCTSSRRCSSVLKSSIRGGDKLEYNSPTSLDRWAAIWLASFIRSSSFLAISAALFLDKREEIKLSLVKKVTTHLVLCTSCLVSFKSFSFSSRDDLSVSTCDRDYIRTSGRASSTCASRSTLASINIILSVSVNSVFSLYSSRER